MFFRNKELKIAMGLFLLLGCVLLPLSFFRDWITGLWVFLCWSLCLTLFIWVERRRHEGLQKIAEDLDALLLHGTELPISEYEEGDLAVLSHQVQKLTRRLTEAKDALQKDKTFLADSLADISHQLRTPLTAMDLTLSLLHQPETEPGKHKDLLRDLRNLLRRTQWLVEALLKLSKLDAGTVRFRKETVSLEGLLIDASAPFAIPMELREQELILNCEDHTIQCDPVWTGEAIGNILKNAIDHSPIGGMITLSGRETPLYTEITVEDQGGGFPPEELPRIFERFYRGKGADPQSCGIGLSLSRSIIAAQNGSIRGENTQEGAKFTLKFYKQLL